MNKVYPSTKVSSTLPNFIVEQYPRFVKFMESCKEADERIGSSQYILQNLINFKNLEIYSNLIIASGFLNVDLNLNDDFIELVNAEGFPIEDGIVLIEDEIILYRRREGNRLFELQRGSSGTTELASLTKQSNYINSTPKKHLAGAEVENISALFFVGILKNIHNTYTDGFEFDRIFSEVNKKTLVSNIKQFFRSKGTKLGIRSLFKILYGDSDVNVEYPGDQIMVASESTWDENIICRTIPVPTVFYTGNELPVDPGVLLGAEFEFRSYNNDKVYATGSIEYTSKYPFGDNTQYDLIINEDNFTGSIVANPQTTLTRDLELVGGSTDFRDVNTVTVQSTLGFPDSGLIFIENEGILYSSKSTNQFFGCVRGHIGVAATHSSGVSVHGPYYLKGSILLSNEDGCYTATSRSWPNNIIQGVEVLNPGLLHEVDALASTEYSGRKDSTDPVINYWIENNQDTLASQGFNPPNVIQTPKRGDIRDTTFGIDSVYFDNNFVYVSNTGLPSVADIGPWDSTSNYGQDLLATPKINVFPKRGFISSSNEEYIKTSGIIGLTVDGVNLISNVSKDKIVQGTITKFNILNAGSGYINPTVVIDPDVTTPSVIVVDGKISEVINTVDTLYTQVPPVRISSGEGLEVELEFDQFGRVTGANIINGGRYYNDVPTLSIIDYSERGRGATISCEVSGGAVSSITVLTPGIDYKPGTTYVDASPVGSGAIVEAVVETYTKDLVAEVDNSSTLFFDGSDGFVFRGDDSLNSLYGIAKNPSAYRSLVSDDGSAHSPIIGWAFDGNPIYGPYGYTNGEDDADGVVRQKSRYKLVSARTGFSPPSEIQYPLGSFIEDYEEDSSIVNLPDTLDANNGKVCNTPEFDKENYPNGVYCYFVTVDDTDNHVFPYIIGQSFNNRPLTQNVKIVASDILEDVNVVPSTDVNAGSIVFDYSKVSRKNDSSLDLLDDSEISISQASTGSISGISIQNRESLVSVGDLVYFDDRNSGGGGSDARVSWIVGNDIESTESCSIITRVISHRQRISLANNPDSSDFVFIPGQFIESISTSNKAKGIVYSWDYQNKILIVQVISKNLFQRGDKFFDKKYSKRYSDRIRQGRSIPSPPFIDSSLQILDPVDAVKPSTQSVNRVTTNNSVLISSTAPIQRYNKSPLIVGDLWWSTLTGRKYVYYGIPGNLTWVQTTPFGSIPTEFASDTNVGYGYSNPYAPNTLPVEDGRVLIADTAPSRRSDDSPIQVGDLWWSSITGNMYIWTGPNVTIDGVSPCDGCGNSFGGITQSYWVITDPSSIRSTENASDQIYVTPGTPSSIISSGNIGVVVSPDAPLSPNNGDLWFSSESGKMYIYYVDVWAVVNPSAMTTSEYSRTYDGTLGDQTPSPVPGQSSDIYGGFYGSLSTINELEETTEIFFESTRHFLGGDLIEIGDYLTHIEIARINDLHVNASRNSVFLQRGIGNTLATIPDAAVVVNRTRYIFTVKTLDPHNLSTGDTVRLSSRDVPRINGEYSVISAGTLDNATATVSINNGQLSDVVITYGGQNYEKNIQFEVNISGGGGAGAYVIAQTNDDGEVESAFIVNPGFGYISDPIAEFLPGCNNTLFSVYVDEPYGNISDLTYTTNAIQVEGFASIIEVLSGGIGYIKLPILPGFIRREIDRAVVKFNMNGTTIESVDVINGGNRYYNPQYVIFTENNLGESADLSINTSDGRITSIDVISGGIGYENPQIIIYEPSQLIPLTKDIGKIVSFTVSSSGRNIYSDKTLKPKLDLPFRLVLEYDFNGDPYGAGWLPGQQITQGKSTAVILSWDARSQTLVVQMEDGLFVSGKSVTNGIDIANVLISGQSDQQLILGGTAELDGKYITEKSHISSSSSYIQDGYYYQLFSYLIESSLQRRSYKDDVNNIIHPAGFFYFA